jgi:hypothetical protein
VLLADEFVQSAGAHARGQGRILAGLLLARGSGGGGAFHAEQIVFFPALHPGKNS